VTSYSMSVVNALQVIYQLLMKNWYHSIF